jgi:tetratricopeptide (TPR) repeat protein
MITELERLGGSLAAPALRRIIEMESNPRVQAQAANSLIRVGTMQDLVFLKGIGLAEKIEAPAITAEIYLSQGLKYMEAKRYEEAIEEFKHALKDSPDDIRTHYEIAMAYLLSEKYTLSVTHFRECLKQQPDNPITHYNLACAHSLMNDGDNAIKHLSLAIQHGYKDLAHMEKDEDLDNIRSDPRYDELRKRLQREKEPPNSPEDE